MFYRALDALRHCLELPSFIAAWDSINHRQFSFFLVYHVHRLWVMMATWESGATKSAIFYMPASSVFKIRGVAPFPESRPSASIDVFLNDWLLSVESKFPADPFCQVNAFGEVIPRAWDRRFLPSAAPSPPPSPSPSPTRPRANDGDPNNLTSRAFRHCLLEKVSSHPDCSRKKTGTLLVAVSPLPAFHCHNDKSIDICFGQCITGLRCVDPSSCARIHLDIRRMRSCPRSTVADIISWLANDQVRARLRLTRGARELSCFP